MPTFDAESTGSITSNTELTVSHTCTGSDLVLIVCVSTYKGSEEAALPTVTYNGVSMVEIDNTIFGSSNAEKVSMFVLKGPATGANDIVVTVSPSQDEIVLAAASYTGVDQTTPTGTPSKIATDGVTSTSLTITDGATGDLVVDAMANYSSADDAAVGANQTRNAFIDGGSSTDSAHISSEPGGSSIVMSWSWAGSENPGHIAVNLFAATAATQDISPNLKSQLIAASNPSLAPGSVDISPGLVIELLAAFLPTVTPGSVDISPGLLQKLVVVFDPALSTGPVDISPELAQQLVSAFSAIITTGSVDISPALAQELINAFNPATTTGAVNLDPDLAIQLVNAFLPQLDQILNLDLVQKLLAGIDPTLTYEAHITPDLTQQLVVTYDPVAAPGAVFITPALLQTLLAGVDPVVSGGIILYPDVANQLVLAYDPIVALGAGPTQDISPAIMQQLTSANDPTVAPGSVAITPELLQALINGLGVQVSGDGQPGAMTTMSDWSG